MFLYINTEEVLLQFKESKPTWHAVDRDSSDSQFKRGMLDDIVMVNAGLMLSNICWFNNLHIKANKTCSGQFVIQKEECLMI